MDDETRAAIKDLENMIIHVQRMSKDKAAEVNAMVSVLENRCENKVYDVLLRSRRARLFCSLAGILTPRQLRNKKKRQLDKQRKKGKVNERYY